MTLREKERSTEHSRKIDGATIRVGMNKRKLYEKLNNCPSSYRSLSTYKLEKKMKCTRTFNSHEFFAPFFILFFWRVLKLWKKALKKMNKIIFNFQRDGKGQQKNFISRKAYGKCQRAKRNVFAFFTDLSRLSFSLSLSCLNGADSRRSKRLWVLFSFAKKCQTAAQDIMVALIAKLFSTLLSTSSPFSFLPKCFSFPLLVLPRK